jgi:hypothetical protein
MDLTVWGEYVLTSACTSAIVYKPKSKATYHITLFDPYQEVELKSEDKTLLTFKDIKLDPGNLSSFKRIIRDQEYLFENGVLLLKKLKRKTPFLTKITKSAHRSSKIITMDLDTRTIKDVTTPYCISIFDGKVSQSFYLSDYNTSSTEAPESEMLKDSIYYLMKRKYDQHKVFLHNFSHFDGVYLLRVLSTFTETIRPIIRDGRIIDLKFSFGKYKLYFRDSYLL